MSSRPSRWPGQGRAAIAGARHGKKEVQPRACSGIQERGVEQGARGGAATGGGGGGY
jgi:hypothetical protein